MDFEDFVKHFSFTLDLLGLVLHMSGLDLPFFGVVACYVIGVSSAK